jgi:anaerobic magnesium-protoporphyrin IX monomethyl ester cyclase
MTDILLAHGYFIAEDEHEQKIMKPYPPLGIMYISSHLKARGFAVRLFDSTFETLATFEVCLHVARPAVVGLYCNLMTKFNILRMIDLCGQVGIPVILGGPEPASYAAEYLAYGADVIVIGEGELTLEALLPALLTNGRHRLHHVPGIVFTDEDGQVVLTPPRPQISDLSAQPWPDRESVPMQRYLDTWRLHHGYSATSLITARGCPYTCTWCSHSVFGQSHRRRLPEDVANEVAWLVEAYGPDQLWYADDVLTIHPRWFLQYCEELKRRKLEVPFECISRADRLSPPVMDALAQMGCFRLWLGAESGSQRVLDGMQRKTQVEEVQARTSQLQSRGISVGMFIMLGYDGEEVEDIEVTVEHLKKANPDVFLTTVAYPIKGTAYYKQVADRVTSHLPWHMQTDRDLKVTGRHSYQFYQHATRWMVSEVKLYKLIRAGSTNYPRMVKLFLNARRGRLGMSMTQSERETGDQKPGSGRGWRTEQRAADAW